MKLLGLELNPFAGTVNRSIRFGQGLNVILGPNEAGKSTLLNALRCLFFTPTQLSSHKFKNEMARFLPVQGGDTLRVASELEFEGMAYRLKKSWGGSKETKLILPGGADLTDAAKVEAELAKKLGFSQAVYEQVLLTRQNQLAETIKALREQPESTLSLSDKLRQSLYELDGISVQSLKKEVEQKIKDFFSRWDASRNVPEGGKDITNPWLKEVGIILKSYYERSERERSLSEAQAYENRLDELNAKLAKLQDNYSEVQAFVSHYEPLVAELQQRKGLEMELGKLGTEIKQWDEVAGQWPAKEYEYRQNLSLKEEKEKQLLQAEARLKEWREYLKMEEERKLYDQAVIMIGRMELLKAEKQGMPQVRGNDINEIRKLLRELDRARDFLNALKLKVYIRAKKDTELKIRRGAEPPEDLRISEGEAYLADAAGRFQADHPDFTILVGAGDKDVGGIMKDIEVAEKKFRERLGYWNVESIEALEVLKSAFEKKQAEEDFVREQYEKLMNGRKFSEIEKAVQQLKKPEIEESAEVLQERSRMLSKEFTEHNAAASFAGRQIEDWARKYESQENLRSLLLNALAKQKELERQLSGMKSLPGEITGTEAFLEDFGKKKILQEELREALNAAKMEWVQLKANAPQTSSEELKEQAEMAKQVFAKNLAAGKAYLRVKQELDEILEALDKDTFQPLKEKTEYYFHRLTAGKYEKLIMDEMIPGSIAVQESLLPATSLSAGTLDLLALATRLAMADFYLADKEGFIILDDPLVNLDPERQKMASACLREIAEKRQVIILTCHPLHAEMLQGELISL